VIAHPAHASIGAFVLAALDKMTPQPAESATDNRGPGGV